MKLLEVLQGKPSTPPPLWLMRQAGRYLPEYRAVRTKAGGFLDLCLTSDLAAEVTLQPIRKFGFDAAIIFADILLVPHALGRKLVFIENEGPKLEPLPEDWREGDLVYREEKIAAVADSLRKTRKGLKPETALIGFCGAPWTVACYMIDGHSTKDGKKNQKTGFPRAQEWAAKKRGLLDKLIEELIKTSVDYLSMQIEAGANVVQIFDSWAGLLTPFQFRRFALNPMKQMVAELQARYPDVPVIGFPRGATPIDTIAYAKETGVRAVSVGHELDLGNVRKVQDFVAVQGNLDPALLLAGGEPMRMQVKHILATLGQGAFIFNLGHGIDKETPPEHVAELVKLVRGG